MNFWDKHKTITCYYESLTKSLCDKYNLTQMEYDTLVFLYQNPNYKTAADIVKVRKSTKSHVSTSLKNLEKKGLIEKIQSEENKKCIEIFILDKAKEILNEGISAQKKFMANMFKGISEDEIIIFKKVFKKICDNADDCLRD